MSRISPSAPIFGSIPMLPISSLHLKIVAIWTGYIVTSVPLHRCYFLSGAPFTLINNFFTEDDYKWAGGSVSITIM
jgi:hypothetical protein